MTNSFLLLDKQISKYEGFLIDEARDEWNQSLPYLGVVTQIFSGIFMILTSVIIRVFYGENSVASQNRKIRNAFSFNMLTLIYSLCLILAAILQGLLMRITSNEIFLLPYIVSLVLIGMLIFLFVTDKEVMDFYKRKLKRYLEIRKEFYQVQPWTIVGKKKISPMTNTDIELGEVIGLPNEGDPGNVHDNVLTND